MKKLRILLTLCLIFFSLSVQGQGEISGTVTDAATGSPLVGVTVQLAGTSNGTITNDLGHYSIETNQKEDSIIFSYVGYIDKKVAIGDQSVIDVTLVTSSKSLNELVVTGYMTQKKADLTGAVTVVDSKDIEKKHGSTNVLTALQGKVPGMTVSTDGNPAGNGTGVRIRGLTSVNGAPPLIVIDGVPASGMNLRDINPNNIASIQVLKDAYSASIYGAQGAGGVILIQTKKGTPGKTKVTYSGMVGFSDWMNKPQLLDTKQYGRALWQAAVNGGRDPNDATQIYSYDWHKNDQGIPVLDKVIPIKQFNDTMFAANTDWLDAVSHLGLQTDHQITVSGGNSKATSLLSLDYFKNEGFIIHTGIERYTVRLNTSYEVIDDHFEIGENAEFSRMNMGTQDYLGAIHQAMVEPPILPVHTKNGGWGGTAVGLGMDDYWNPVRSLTQNKNNRNKYNKVIGGVYANVYFLKHFTFHTQLGLIYTEGNHRTIGFTFREGGGKIGDISSVDQWYWWEAEEDWTNTLQFKLHKGKSDIQALVGMEAKKYTTETTSGNRQDIQFQNYNYAYLGTATGNMSMDGFGGKYAFLSYFGKVNYVYNSKYLLSASLRHDGSSKFGRKNQFGLFPAVSAGWRLSNEDFIKEVSFISNLKFRVSWGVNGNSHIPTGSTYSLFAADYDYTSYAIAGNETGNNPSGFNKLSTGNPALKWETSKQINVGLDFGLFNSRFTGSIDYYRKATNGMLFQPPYLGTIGEGGYRWVNAADMTDRGVELQLSYHNNPNSAFRWNLSGNISHNKNEITNLPPNVRFAYGGSTFKGDDIDGRPFHSTYGFIADGIFKTQEEVDNSAKQPGKGIGRIKYKDISGPDGKPDGVVDYNYDQTWIATWDPKVQFGLSFNANYKNFDFYMFWQGRAGLTVYDQFKTYSDFWNVYVQNGFNHPVRILDAWSPSNPDSNIPALAMTNNNDELRMSTYLLASGDYLKLRNLQIGYTLPVSLTSTLDIQKLRIYIMASNLLTIKKWWGKNAYVGPDPEVSNTGDASYQNPYIIPTVFKTGVEVTF